MRLTIQSEGNPSIHFVFLENQLTVERLKSAASQARINLQSYKGLRHLGQVFPVDGGETPRKLTPKRTTIPRPVLRGFF
jgi:hypothetical protein